jgi:hypothetical protein
VGEKGNGGEGLPINYGYFEEAATVRLVGSLDRSIKPGTSDCSCAIVGVAVGRCGCYGYGRGDLDCTADRTSYEGEKDEDCLHDEKIRGQM